MPPSPSHLISSGQHQACWASVSTFPPWGLRACLPLYWDTVPDALFMANAFHPSGHLIGEALVDHYASLSQALIVSLLDFTVICNDLFI